MSVIAEFFFADISEAHAGAVKPRPSASAMVGEHLGKVGEPSILSRLGRY